MHGEIGEVVVFQLQGAIGHNLVAGGCSFAPHSFPDPNIGIHVQFCKHRIGGSLGHTAIVFRRRGVFQIADILVDFAFDEIEKCLRSDLGGQFRVSEIRDKRQVAEPVDALQVQIGTDHLHFRHQFFGSVEFHVRLIHLVQNLVAAGDSVHDKAVGSPYAVVGFVPAVFMILDPNAVVPPETAFAVGDDAFVRGHHVVHPDTHVLEVAVAPGTGGEPGVGTAYVFQEGLLIGEESVCRQFGIYGFIQVRAGIAAEQGTDEKQGVYYLFHKAHGFRM